jgi:hypothetical protein
LPQILKQTLVVPQEIEQGEEHNDNAGYQPDGPAKHRGRLARKRSSGALQLLIQIESRRKPIDRLRKERIPFSRYLKAYGAEILPYRPQTATSFIEGLLDQEKAGRKNNDYDRKNSKQSCWIWAQPAL